LNCELGEIELFFREMNSESRTVLQVRVDLRGFKLRPELSRSSKENSSILVELRLETCTRGNKYEEEDE
jgi:hypothetical protein